MGSNTSRLLKSKPVRIDKIIRMGEPVSRRNRMISVLCLTGSAQLTHLATDEKLAVGHAQFRILLKIYMHLHHFMATIFEAAFIE